jgi:hypothetical protein
VLSWVFHRWKDLKDFNFLPVQQFHEVSGCGKTRLCLLHKMCTSKDNPPGDWNTQSKEWWLEKPCGLLIY